MTGIKWVATALVSAAAVLGIQFQLAKVPPPEVDVNMLFVPPEGLTRHLATGHENVIADGLWLGLLQYYGDRMVREGEERRFVNLAPMFDLITDLDPQFWFAYWLGAWALVDAEEPDAAVTLLKKGHRLNPTDYNYPYLEGFVQFLGREDYPAAAKAFELAATLPDAPRFATSMAARMHEHTGQAGLSLQIWRGLADNPDTDAHTRSIAKKNVERILAEMRGEKPKAFKRAPGSS